MNDQNISVLEESRDKFWPSAASVAKKLVIEKGKTKRIMATKRKTEQQVRLKRDAPISNHFNNFNFVCSCTHNIYCLSAHPMRWTGRTVAVVHCTDRRKIHWRKSCDAKMIWHLSKQLQCDLLTIFVCILTTFGNIVPDVLMQIQPISTELTHTHTHTHTQSHIYANSIFGQFLLTWSYCILNNC